MFPVTLDMVIEKSKHGTVSHLVRESAELRERVVKKDPTVLGIQRQGCESQVVKHLTQAKEDRELFGPASRDEQIGEALKLVAAAGFTTIDEIATKHGLQDVVDRFREERKHLHRGTG